MNAYPLGAKPMLRVHQLGWCRTAKQVLTSATEDAAEAMASYRGRREPEYRNR
jgi:hypothetical protein